MNASVFTSTDSQPAVIRAIERMRTQPMGTVNQRWQEAKGASLNETQHKVPAPGEIGN